MITPAPLVSRPGTHRTSRVSTAGSSASRDSTFSSVPGCWASCHAMASAAKNSRCRFIPLAAAAGGAAAFADVAAAGRAHLGAAGQAERGVGGAALLGFDQLGGAVRGGGHRAARRRRGGGSGGRGVHHGPFGRNWLFYGGRLGKFLGIHLLAQPGGVVPGRLGGAL